MFARKRTWASHVRPEANMDAATLAGRMGNEASTMAAARARATSALRRPHNWVHLAKFCPVAGVT